jgi:hypothetical protein
VPGQGGGHKGRQGREMAQDPSLMTLSLKALSQIFKAVIKLVCCVVDVMPQHKIFLNIPI